THSDTKVTTAIMSALRRSMRKPTSMCTPSLSSQVYTGASKVGAPASDSLRTMSDSTQDAATARHVTVCAPTRPISLPPRPAITAAASGSSGMASSTVGFTASAFQGVQVFDVDAAPLAEQHHQDGEPDGGLGRRHGEDEEHEHLAVDVAEVAREGDEVEVGGEQQQLDAHEQENDVLAVEEDAGHRQREQHARERQQLCQADHGRFSAAIFTSRTRSSRRTATCLLMSWYFRPARRRMVRVMAATIATSSSMAASSSG